MGRIDAPYISRLGQRHRQTHTTSTKFKRKEILEQNLPTSQASLKASRMTCVALNKAPKANGQRMQGSCSKSDWETSTHMNELK